MYSKILEHSTEKFLTFGFKSVTMDEIAQDLGISKKTLYQYFSNKEDLVAACVFNVFDFISKGIDKIKELNKNPIEEMFNIKNFVMNFLKNEQSSPQYQLKKFYPEIYSNIQDKVFEKMSEIVVDSLNKGIKKGFFREEINVDFIFRLYFKVINLIKEKEIFGEETNNSDAEELYLDYHIRGIATKKGLEFYCQFKNIKTND